MVQQRVAAAVAPATPPSAPGEAESCRQRDDHKADERSSSSSEGPTSHHVLDLPTTPTRTSTAGGSSRIRKASKLARTYSRPVKLLLLLFFLLIALSLLTTTSSLLKYVPLHATLRYLTVSQQPPLRPLSLIDWLAMPSTADHGMTDDELFWRSTLVPQIKKYPFQRVPKVAFLFLARGHLPLYPLWEKFLAGNQGLYSLYVHSSLPDYLPQYPPNSPFYGRQIPSKVAEWGEMSMVDAERRLLANALLDISNDRFVLLSESCIPLRNFSTVYHYLTGSLHSFVSVFDDPGPFGRGRYDPRMAPLVPFHLWRKGSQWFEVDREAAVAIASDTRYYPLFRDRCRPPCYVDEHYIPTMLTVERPETTANRSVTRVDWSRGGPHPAMFGARDLEREGFLRRIIEAKTPCEYNGQKEDTVCYLFARKFAPSALKPLLELSLKVLGF